MVDRISQSLISKGRIGYTVRSSEVVSKRSNHLSISPGPVHIRSDQARSLSDQVK